MVETVWLQITRGNWQISYVSGGDKVPRKGGPGITQSDLLVVNKTDLAEKIATDLGVMERDARKMQCVFNCFF